MKKILLGTTMLIGAAGLFAGAALADSPKVTVGGVADFQYGYVDEDLDTTQRESGFKSDTELSFKIDGKTDAGLGYGGEIVLEADTTDDADTQGTNASKTLVYLSGGWGRLEGGSTTGAASALKVDASRIARATGGIDGDFTYFFDATGVSSADDYAIATPDLPLDYGFDGTFGGSGSDPQFGDEELENANKVSYYTPRFSGFQAGVSYLVDANRGQTVDRDNTDSPVVSVIEAGINYEGTFSGVGVAAAVTGTSGDATAASTEDLQAWNAGLKLAYLGFSVAGSYGDWGDSLRTASNLDESNYWTLGAAYEYGPYAASVTYLDSTFAATSTTENEFTNLSVGVDYKLAPGLTPYAEVSFVEYDAVAASTDNDATVFIAGTQLAF